MTKKHQALLFSAPAPAPAQDAGHARRAGGIEQRFDIPFTSELALKEKQIQQNVRPTIAIHKWFARRPGTLFRSLLLSEFGQSSLREAFFSSNDLSGLVVADPFMGGGTPIIEANRLGMDVVGWDVNPMAYWIVAEALRTLDTSKYQVRAREIAEELSTRVGDLYGTECPRCLGPAFVKYFIWIKTARCNTCGKRQTLFPGSTIALAGRHPRNVFVCQGCGEVYESADESAACSQCRRDSRASSCLVRGGWACTCCNAHHELPAKNPGPQPHELVAIEAHCPRCSTRGNGRLFKRPDEEDRARVRRATKLLKGVDTRWLPDEAIPPGDETGRLHRWGYTHYKELFNERQLLGLATLADIVEKEEDERLANAFATNISDLVRYQNLLCRYDTKALKSLDVFSVHGFPVSLVQCESNIIGIRRLRTGALVGSGGWLNVTEKYYRAKQYCENPFETRYRGGKKSEIPTEHERIGDKNADGSLRRVSLRCGSAMNAEIAPGSLDAVITDPPYFANVQYAELMDFCYVWLRRLIRGENGAFRAATTRNPAELTGNVTLGRDLQHFADGLSRVFARFSAGLRKGAPFIFTYHHNKREAYDPITVAILDSRLVVTRALPCPGEMGGSIHIQGTGSSILDSVFVCRHTGAVRRRELVTTAEGLRDLVRTDLLLLQQGGITPTRGDARCLTFGHLTRLASWALRNGWNPDLPAAEKLERVRRFAEGFGEWASIVTPIADELKLAKRQHWEVLEPESGYGQEDADAIFF